MADTPLNNSWPSFSKLWMKRLSFKRASECKPYSEPIGQTSGHAAKQASGHSSGQQHVQLPRGTSSPSPSPPSITEDVFFGGTNEDQDASSVVSDSEVKGVEVSSSADDLQGLGSSFWDSDYFRDLEVNLDGPLKAISPDLNSLTTAPNLTDSSEETPGNLVVTKLSPKVIPSCVIDSHDSSGVALSLTIDLDGLLGSMETTPTETGSRNQGNTVHLNGDVEVDSFPNLVRSMSTSRRHSWGVSVAPINLGRRLSLDTMATNSDGDEDEAEHNEVFQSNEQKTENCPLDETDGLKERLSCLVTKTDGVPGKQLYSRADILATDECSRAAHISRIVQTSKEAARAAGAEEFDPEEHLHSNEGQSHIAKRRNNKANAKDSENVTWYEFLSNENEEEDDRSEKREKGTKVKRTLSSLRNRMTGSLNKDKGKNREKEQQRGKEKGKEAKESEFSHSNGHLLAPGTFSSCASCSLCGKTLQKNHSLQCMNCAVNVHRSCKSLLSECTSIKNKRDSLSRTGPSGSPYLAAKERQREQEQSSQILNGHATFLSAPGMTIIPRGSSNQLIVTHNIASSGIPAFNPGLSIRHHSSSGSLLGEMDETDALRLKRCNDDAISLVASTTESIIVEDAQYAAVRADLECDAQDLEAESWSLAVDQQFVKRHSKEAVKRQDVIYELMQTEMHHVRTLKIMLRVYIRELKDNLQMDSSRLECLFPRVESLLDLHTHFLSCLRERRRESIVSPTECNYTVDRIADILIAQFSGDVGEKMKDSYGDFCSHHTEAVNYYKEQMQTNKRFHSIVRKINNLSIVRRLGVPECILLVTQRITKYPALVERILHSTQEGTEEHTELNRALSLIKDTIVQVDALVNLHEKTCRLRDIYSKMEPKALGKIKDGRVFRREDLAQGRRRLLHEGTVNWKAASGRLKDILAVLLSDVLLLLQEKDQRYVFAAVDNKPSVISLQKLIVREVAHAERAMFLICASSNEPEMYEIHTNSKEERNTWMTQIRQAVESCPHTEERLFSEEEEARASRLKEFQERLSQKDAVIVQALSEKLQLFADMAESVAGLEDTASRPKLLLRGDASDLQQGETLLKGAITEVENLQNLLQSGVRGDNLSSQQDEGSSSGLLPRRAGTFGGYDSNPTTLTKNGNLKKNFTGESRNRDRSQRASSDPQLKDLCGSQTLEQTVDETCSTPARWNLIWSNSFPEAEFFDKVLMLSQRLYSLQAIIAQQDSHIELQRVSLTERASLPGRHRGNVLLEQEKQRTLALQREELASFHKLQSQHRQEQQRWEKERGKHRQLVEATEARLRQREEECRRLEERLAEERVELERQRETYQQDLERLRESTRAVEKEKERLEHQKKIKRKTIEVAPMSGSLNGELLLSSGLSSSPGLSDKPLPPKSLVRGSMSVAPADYPERPEVTLRRDASSSTLPLKTEVPLHLFSTTNQQHKLVGVQQQIPTKLAALSSGKGKGVKGGKASQRTDSTASVDMKQILPLKLSARDDSTFKAKCSVSPHQQAPLSVSPLPPSFHHLGDHQQNLLDAFGPDSQSTGISGCHPATIQKPPVPPAQTLSAVFRADSRHRAPLAFHRVAPLPCPGAAARSRPEPPRARAGPRPQRAAPFAAAALQHQHRRPQQGRRSSSSKLS
ncbi:LOW QUALITY PROTEIN: rho guanine nucleotide exchange factor 18 [Syngnathus acus]|uniref:LOW QUALITY PROTEIN: rho guanine nucleotide exchange factor 18 n=1 Tax=Syngnathus acus TaxID=161584 RepID=UPI001885CBCC|nr:LOW QUALITY PROTEIN: rho guanine nucleotide exchange factor 18 [Syngnathus acus]